jgi:molybdopterin molybdotransferase
MLQAASESDIVILTGGISAGDFDFVPAVIEQAGFDIKFRSIAVQPGKPVIFATKASQYIVALPGNPVSSFVQFELLVKFLINLISGCRDTAIELNLPMGVDIQRKKNVRKAFYPVRISAEGTVFPVEYHGSAHIHSYINADGILTLEIGKSGIKKGELAHVRLL